MKILVISAWFPFPPDNGARIRTYNLIKGLAKRHEVCLISLLQEESNRYDAVHLADICRVLSLHESRWFKPARLKSILGYLSTRPRSCVDTYDSRVSVAVQQAIKEETPDVVVASTLGAAEYVPRGLAVPSVLEEHNCEYAVLKRSAVRHENCLKKFRYTLGWRKFSRWEARVCRRFDLVTMVSELDCQLIRAAAPDLPNLVVIPNGVDVERYTAAGRRPEEGLLIYNGALTYSANLDAVRYYINEIYPLMKDAGLSPKLLITGRTAGVDLSGVADSPGIELVGYVADIREVLNRASACVVPLRQGGGSRLKILEAMAAGVPVVSTSIGAEGIEAEDGRHLLLADTPQRFVSALGMVLGDKSFADDMARNARRLVEECYSWAQIAEDFAALLESTVRQGH